MAKMGVVGGLVLAMMMMTMVMMVMMTTMVSASVGACVESGGNWYCRNVQAITYTNFGKSGSYEKVVDMDGCKTVKHEYSGSLAPLDEEVTVVFRGPIHLKQFAAYAPAPTKHDDKVKRSIELGHHHQYHGHSHVHLHQARHAQLDLNDVDLLQTPIDIHEEVDGYEGVFMPETPLDELSEANINAFSEANNNASKHFHKKREVIVATWNSDVFSWTTTFGDPATPTIVFDDPQEEPTQTVDIIRATWNGDVFSWTTTYGQPAMPTSAIDASKNVHKDPASSHDDPSKLEKGSAKQNSPEQNPPNQGPPLQDPSKQGTPQQDLPEQNHPKHGPPKQNPPKQASRVSGGHDDSSHPGTHPPPKPANPNAPIHAASSKYKVADGEYQRTAFYHSESGKADGLVFLKQLFAPLAFCSKNGQETSSKSQILDDVLLPSNHEFVIFSDKKCSGQNGDCGYFNPKIEKNAYHGFGGKHKVFVFEFSMPLDDIKDGLAPDTPAIWLINSEISRTDQYGCSCWTSGCGELDIFEVLTKGDERMKSTYHSDQSLGSSDYFTRPTGRSIKAAVVMGDHSATIRILHDDFEMGDVLTKEQLEHMKSDDGLMTMERLPN